MELHFISGSPYSWRVLLALEAKRLEYTTKLLSMARRDLDSSEFRALNPRGRVPVLTDGSIVVRESLAILAYLERKVPEPVIFGRDAAEAARIWQSALEYQSYLDAAVEDFILPLYFGKAHERREQAEAAASRVKAELLLLDARLGTSPFLAGAAYTAADMTAFPGI